MKTTLPFDIWHYPFRVIPRVYKTFLFQSPSKRLLDMTSIIPAHIPVRLSRLPLNGTHNLFAAILENPVALFAIEQDPEYRTTPLVHHYIRLYHNYACARVDLTTASTLSSIALQRWSNRLATMRFEILQLLMLVEYGKYIEKCVPAEILQSLLRTTLLLLPDVYREEYLSNEDGRITFEHADPSIVPSPSDSTNQVDSIPTAPAVPTPAQSPRPVPPPLRRRSGLPPRFYETQTGGFVRPFCGS